jgi:hypothetical protein
MEKMFLDENPCPQPFTNSHVENPTLAETPELDVWQSSSKKNSYWMNTGACGFFTRSLKPVRNVFGVQAKAICGLKPGAPALGF